MPGLLALLLAQVAAVPTSVPPSVEDERLLLRSDTAAHAPASFRARLRLSVPERSDPAEIEVWRSGESKTLVRFLDPKERGKYLLYRDGVLYFFAPGARKPVKLPSSYRLRGSASLDDILGLHYSRDFSITGLATEAAGETALVAFELAARNRSAAYSRVLYVVNPRTARPVRAEYRLKSGRSATTVDFAEWEPGPVPRVRKLVLRDMLRGGSPTVVEMLELTERPVPAGLFDLRDASERRKLETSAQPTP